MKTVKLVYGDLEFTAKSLAEMMTYVQLLKAVEANKPLDPNELAYLISAIRDDTVKRWGGA